MQKQIKHIQTNKAYNDVEAENSKVNKTTDLKETKSLRKKIRQLEAELKKKMKHYLLLLISKLSI